MPEEVSEPCYSGWRGHHPMLVKTLQHQTHVARHPGWGTTRQRRDPGCQYFSLFSNILNFN